MQAFLSARCTDGLYFAGSTLRMGRCMSRLALPPETRMPAARQSYEKRHRAPPIEHSSPHHCILLGERPPFPRPTRPKTPKVCVIASPGPVAPKHAGRLPGTMRATDPGRRPARVYNAYFSAFPAREPPCGARTGAPRANAKGAPEPLGPDAPFLTGSQPGVLGWGPRPWGEVPC